MSTHYSRLFRLLRLFVIVKFGSRHDPLWRITSKDGYATQYFFMLGRTRKAEGPVVWIPWNLCVGPLWISWAWITREEGQRVVDAHKDATP